MVKFRKAKAVALGIGALFMATAVVSAESWKFGLMSDTQWKSNIDGENPNTVAAGIIRQLNAEFIRHDVKMVLQVGDLVDRYSSPAFDTRAQGAQELIDAGIGFFPLRGNHESSSSAAIYFSTSFPQACGYINTFGASNFQSASMNLECLSYSFDYNNVRFVLLDQFTRKDNSGLTNNNMIDQIGWVNDVLGSRDANTHAFVMAHKNIIGQNHFDVLFGSNMSSNISAQNQFFKALSDNGVRYYFGGHDHMHHRSIVYSPDRNYTIKQLIGASNSYKFYTPVIPSADQRYSGNSPRELPLAQELYTVGYYIFTVDGARITCDYYSSLNGCGGEWGSEVDCNLNVTPVLSFQKRETFGYSLNGKEYVVTAGNTLTVVSDTCKLSGSENTKASIINGENIISPALYDGRSLVQNITTGWQSKSDAASDLKSDVLTLWGMANNLGSDESDIYTLSLSYKGELSGPLSLVTKDGNGNWVGATSLNFSSEPKFVVGPCKSSFGIGTYGIDTEKKIVWAVVNHGGEFAVKSSSDGDQDGDGDVDNADIAVITSLKNKPADVKPSADLDNDGKITVLDARKLVLIKNR
ncbi:MAG: metallophosphoesterase [Chitinispirillaceae bacterium]|nr:metallophosphoesterase [Chitinispirillaceae bacterium]